MADSDYFKKIEKFAKERYGEQKATDALVFARNRYNDLLLENKDEPKALKMHTKDRIYPAIAMFDGLIHVGIERTDAAEFLNWYYKWRAEQMAKFVKGFAGLPGMYKKFPGIFTSMTKKMFGEAAGFKANFYDIPKTELKFDMIKCPYYEISVKYGCPEIVPGFCDSDDVCYGNMHPKLVWGRTKTIGKGGDCCDFRMTVKE